MQYLHSSSTGSHSRSLRLVVLCLTLLGGCLKTSAPATLTALPDTLTLTGSVMNATGSPVGNVAVYLESDTKAAATTAADGSYSIKLDSGVLLRISGGSTSPRNSFCLYFSVVNDASQQAVSTAIDLSIRGTKAVPPVTLAQAGSISGTLLQVIDGKQPGPAAATVVSAGRASATTAADGSFKLTSVPAGTTMLTASAPLSAPAQQAVILKAGETKTLASPLVLFPATGVYGVILLSQVTPIADLIAQGHPYQRTFAEIGSATAAFIRYSADASNLSNATWHRLGTSFDFDFAKDGGNVIYYQFTDAAQKTISPMQQLAVVIDQYANSTGFVIEDGSGVVKSRTAVLHIDVPAAAHRMRLAESPADLGGAPWQATAATSSWVFSQTRDAVTGVAAAFGLRTIYLQFEDANSVVGPTYQQTATFQIFPDADSDAIFTLNGGIDVLPSRLAQMSINMSLVPNAYQMQMWEADITSNVNVIFPAVTDSTAPFTRNTWLAVQPESFFTFTSIGRKTLYLQFRTLDLAVSPVYKHTVDVIPFPTGSGGFTINGPVTTGSPMINIDLKAPPNAIGFRIFESPLLLVTASLLPTTSWLTPVPNFNYHVNGTGAQVIYVQFQDSNLAASSVYQQTVSIEPDNPNSGGLVISDLGGTPILASANPNVQLNITTPQNFGVGQSFMQIWDCLASTPNCTQPTATRAVPSQPTAATYPWILSGAGAHMICVNFSNTELGTYSNARCQNVFYQPFPTTMQAISLAFPQNTLGVTTVDGITSVHAVDATSATLNLTALPNVTGMRLSNDVPPTSATAIQAFSATVNSYALPATVGIHTVYVQFNTVTDTSPVYSVTYVVAI